jgi:hypothetical protein
MTNPKKADGEREPTTFFQMASSTDPEVAAVSPSEIVGSATFSGYPASGTPTNDVRLPDELPLGDAVDAVEPVGTPAEIQAIIAKGRKPR